MSNMIGKKVRIRKEKHNSEDGFKIDFFGDVNVIDKVMTCSSEYYGKPVMNNASFEVYVGVSDNLNENRESVIVLFKPTDIKIIY